MSLLPFQSDYMEGAHPSIIKKLSETNLFHTVGYGSDEFSEEARALIRKACGAPNAEVQFLVGGTQTNAVVIDCILNKWQGVFAADSGHVAVHEAGAIEFTGHKVLPIKGEDGKLTAAAVDSYISDFYKDANWTHMVEPGMVYISQPTELGTMYSKSELSALSEVCRRRNVPLFVDGARLAYALGSDENDISLEDLARLADVFYIGGTKCGALFGEAVVLPNPELIPHFITQIKQHGALLAKGRISGIQFGELFKNSLYLVLGKTADAFAQKIQDALVRAGYQLYFKSPTNQVFFIIGNEKLKSLGEKVLYGFLEKYDENRTVIRFCTSWATTQSDVDSLLEVIKSM